MPKFSIIIPSYNQGPFIGWTLKSIFSQSYEDVEVIVFDNCSNDSTHLILKQFENHRLKVFIEKDQGQAHAINKGLKMSSGDYVGWLNSDDVLVPGALNRILDASNKVADYKYTLFYGKSMLIDRFGIPFRSFSSIPVTHNYLKRFNRNVFCQPGVFWGRGVLDSVGLLREDLHYSFDTEYWLRVSKSFRMHYIRGHLGCLRIHEETKSSQFKEKFRKEALIIDSEYGREFRAYFFKKIERIYRNASIIIDQKKYSRRGF